LLYTLQIEHNCFLTGLIPDIAGDSGLSSNASHRPTKQDLSKVYAPASSRTRAEMSDEDVDNDDSDSEKMVICEEEPTGSNIALLSVELLF
jgi:hypothetical protein